MEHMKILRNFGIVLALLAPVAAIASPKITASCCDGSCCPGCPFCPSGMHR